MEGHTISIPFLVAVKKPLNKKKELKEKMFILAYSSVYSQQHCEDNAIRAWSSWSLHL